MSFNILIALLLRRLAVLWQPNKRMMCPESYRLLIGESLVLVMVRWLCSIAYGL